MKILIVTYSFTPDLTPRAFRWSAIAEELARMGHDVHVLCSGRVVDETSAAGEAVTVHRVSDWLLDASTRVAPRATAPPTAGKSTRTSWWKPLARRAVKTVWRMFHWPDYACGWIIPGARAARALCAQHRFDWVISVSHPFTGHVVGWLAMRRAPHTKWLVDIGDPFSLMSEPPPNNLTLYARVNRYAERCVLSNAQAISVTTEATLRLYEKHFPLGNIQVQVIPPLLSLPQPPPETSIRAFNAPIRLVFVGTLYRHLRSPRHLLECFDALVQAQSGLNLELHFYGSVNDCADQLAACTASAQSRVRVHGLVDRQSVFLAMREADVLVNIGNGSECQLASKVIEYMAMGKPILNLITIAKDTSLEALANYPNKHTVVCTAQRHLAPDALDALRQFLLHPPPPDHAAAQRTREQHSAAQVTRMYARLLERVAT